MSNHVNSTANGQVTLVGLGAMATEYAKVLKHLNTEVIAIGRSENSCQQFTKTTQLKSYAGGVLHNKNLISKTAIVAANVESLGEITKQLIECGTKNILVEKPGALSIRELNEIKSLADKNSAQVFIAYNRRFLPSVHELLQRIKKEGGLQTGYFEFTEWSHVIGKLPDSPAKRTTFISNSTHVLDLAFFLMGKPTDYTAYTAGAKMFDWNEGPTQFVGSGKTDKNVLFSYHANWTSAGRWGVEVLTKESRYILRPIEKLFRQPVGSVQVEEIPLPPAVADLKPGLLEQVTAFMAADRSGNLMLVSLNEQIEMFHHYERINSVTQK